MKIILLCGFEFRCLDGSGTTKYVWVRPASVPVITATVTKVASSVSTATMTKVWSAANTANLTKGGSSVNTATMTRVGRNINPAVEGMRQQLARLMHCAKRA